VNKVITGAGVAARGAWAAGLCSGGRIILVSEPAVCRRFGKRVLTALKKKYEVSLFLLPSGEKAKTLGSVEKLLSAMLAAGLGRDAALVALGGGTVTDTAGFAASVYLRGIPWVAIPTTLLGQLDSGLGGKTGVNLSEGKNLVGTFWQPSAVICDSDFLKTLPVRERVSGLAEAIKCGLAFDPSLFRYIRGHWDELLAGRPGPTAHVVSKGANWKIKLVAQDERETRGIRDFLNFGHTLGHALEKTSGYGALRHGEAVIWGMRAAIRLSVALTGLPVVRAAEAEDFLAGIEVPVRKKLNARVLLQTAMKDKKVRRGRMRFVLLREFGRPVVKDGVPADKILRAIDSL
jgi:3-dehydroquinate synthase